MKYSKILILLTAVLITDILITKVASAQVEYNEFTDFFAEEIYSHEKPLTLWQHHGYELEYLDAEYTFERSFRERVLEQIKSTPDGGTAFIVVRGSNKGIARGLEIIDAVKKDPKQSKANVTIKVINLVSQQVPSAELSNLCDIRVRVASETVESLREVSPDFETNTSRGIDLMIKTSNLKPCRGAKYIPWEGGKEVLTEIFELVARAETGGKGGGSFELELPAWGGIKAEKGKLTGGFAAASQAALSLGLKEGKLQLGKLKITVPSSSGTTLSSFLKTDNGESMLAAYEKTFDMSEDALVREAILTENQRLRERGLTRSDEYSLRRYTEYKELDTGAEITLNKYKAIRETDKILSLTAAEQVVALENQKSVVEGYLELGKTVAGSGELPGSLAAPHAQGLATAAAKIEGMREDIRRVSAGRLAIEGAIKTERAKIIARAAEKGGKK